MLKDFPLWAKIMLAMAISILVVGGVLTASNLRTLEEVINQAEKKELDGHVRSIAVSIAAEGDHMSIEQGGQDSLPPEVSVDSLRVDATGL